MKTKLYDYQEYGARFAIDRINKHGFCIIADDVGLGKTPQAISVLLDRVNNGAKKIVRRNNGGENEKNQDNSIDVSPEPSKILESQNSKADDSIDNSVIKPENIKEFPKDDAPEYPKTTQISNIDELHVANINISSGKKEKVETPIDFGDFFTSPKNRENLFLITTYLNLEDRINLFSITSKYKNYLANEIEKLKKDFEENNEITITSKIIDKKSELKIKYKEEQLKAEITPFQVSRGAVKAIELLNEELYNRIFHQTELKDPINKIILIYRIYVQLIRKKELSKKVMRIITIFKMRTINIKLY